MVKITRVRLLGKKNFGYILRTDNFHSSWPDFDSKKRRLSAFDLTSRTGLLEWRCPKLHSNVNNSFGGCSHADGLGVS